MAQETVAIKIEVDSGKSVNEVKQLEKEISGLIDETNELNETNIQFKRELQELTQTYNNLPKTALASRKQLSEQMDELKFAIKDNNIALQEFRIKKQQKQKFISDLKDVSKESKTTAKDLGNIAEGMAGGYQAFLGVSALLGGENDKLMATLVKLEGVQATLSAVEKIRNDLKKESEFLTSLNNTKTKIAIGLQKAYAVAIGTGSKAMGGLKKALISTGIGAIVVALGTVVAYWDEIKGAVSGLSSEQKKRNADLEKEKELTQSNLDNIEASENTLRLQGKSEEDILQMKLQQLDAQLLQQEQTIELAEAQKKTQIEASERNNKIAKNTIRILTLPITMLLGAIDMLTYGLEKVGLIEEATNLEESFSGGIASMLFDPEEVAKEGQDTIDEANKKLIELQNKRDGFTLKEQEKRKANGETSKKQIESQNQEELRLRQELEDAIISMEQDADVRALAQLEVKQQRELDALLKSKNYTLEQRKILEKKQALEMDALINQIEADAKLKNDEKIKEEAQALADLKKEIADAEVNTLEEQRAKEFEDLDTYYTDLIQKAKDNKQSTLELEETYLEKTKELKDKYSEEEKNRAEQETATAVANINAQQQARDMLINDIGKGLDMLTFFMKDNEKKQKASALVQIATDTALAISSLVAQSQANALNGVTMGVAGAIQFANGIIQITTNMAKAKQLLSGGSGVTAPSTSVGDTSSMTSAVNNTTTSTGTNNGQSFNPFGGNNNSNRVVLVESELEAMQERRMTTQRIATI